MSLVFWDTNLFIYWMEDHPRHAERVGEIRRRMTARGDRLCTSALTIGEILAGPFLRGQAELARQYKALLAPPQVEILPFDTGAAERYARIRCDRTVAPADAIQLACAAQAGVDLFLTNDHRLSRKSVAGIQFIAGLDVNVL
ncbi:MAG: PIN domain-containing protein [Acidobacteria bacterium]|nr:PIN domain-containing protein [Acidobacteriota bacterium]